MPPYGLQLAVVKIAVPLARKMGLAKRMHLGPRAAPWGTDPHRLRTLRRENFEQRQGTWWERGQHAAGTLTWLCSQMPSRTQ